MAMEFWGVEVKKGESLKVDPGENMILHISQVALGEGRKENGNERIRIYLNVDDQKFVLGTLSHEKFPQFSTEIILEKAFEVSHTWKNGSVYVSGYKVDEEDIEADDFSEDEPTLDNGKLGANINQSKADAAKSTTSSKQVNFVEPSKVAKTQQKKDGNNDEDKDEDMSTSEDDEGPMVSDEDDSDESSNDEDDEDDDDSDEEESSDDETPKKPESSKKRPAEAANPKSSSSNKKAKFVTPQKPDGKKSTSSSVHIATPHPAKQAGKKPSSVAIEPSMQQQTPKSGGGSIPCKSCNRSFTSEVGLQSHTKAKHGAAA